MKKLYTIYIFLLCTLFLIGNVAALDFDNIKSYDQSTKTVTIKNSVLGIPFLELDTVATARLITPQVNYVIPGKDVKVMIFEVENLGDSYKDALKDLEFINLKKDGVKETYKTFHYEYAIYEDVEVLDYGKTCEYDPTIKDEICYNIVNGSHIENQIVRWEKLKDKDLPKGKITIALVTDVKKRDHYDGIPTLFGVKIPEWAEWQDSYSVGLKAYWKIDENTGTLLADSVNGFNMTTTGSPVWTPGKLGSALNFTGNSQWGQVTTNTTELEGSGGNTLSISAWVYPTAYSNYPTIMGRTDGVSSHNYLYALGATSGKPALFTPGEGWTTATTALNLNAWNFIVVSCNAGTCTYYLNGNSDGSTSGESWTPGQNYMNRLSFYGDNAGWEGTLDEIGLWNRSLNSTEVTAMYNGGVGMTYPTAKDPVVTLNSPASANYTTSPQNFNFNCTATDDVEIINVTLYINSILNYTQAGSGSNFTELFINQDLTEGSYSFYCNAYDDEGNLAISTTNRIIIDSTAPILNVTSPTGTFTYLTINSTLNLNWTVQDEGVGLDSCWYIYNNITTSINCSLNQTTFNYTQDVNNLTFYANDTFGKVASNLTAWTYKVFEINQTFNNQTTEGSLETYLATIKLGSGYSISDSVLFNYNGSSSTGQSFTLGENTILRKANFLIPNVVSDVNATFYWSITLSDSTQLNLSSHNQSIYNLAIDNCSSYTKELFNFTVVDEEKQTVLPNVTVETAFNVYDQSRTTVIINYSDIFENINPVRICLNRNITGSSIYSLDSIVRYEDSDHANEYYNIVNQSITSGTNTTRIMLYDLNLTDSTEFQLTFTGSDFLPVENALVYVDRQYISENIFKTVELPKTDYNGQTVLHLVRNDVIYNIRVIKNSVVLGNFESLTAFCDDYTIGDCNIELNAFDSVESIFNYDENLGIIFSVPTYNSTSNIVSFNFVTDDGDTKTVILNVTRNNIFGNKTVCNNTLISSGGTLSCSIDPNLDESILKIEAYVDGETAFISYVQLDSTAYGVAGYLIFFVMLISLILMFRGSKTGVLISIILAFISGIALGIINGQIIGIGASVLWIIVMCIVGVYKLNKNREQ